MSKITGVHGPAEFSSDHRIPLSVAGSIQILLDNTKSNRPIYLWQAEARIWQVDLAKAPSGEGGLEIAGSADVTSPTLETLDNFEYIGVADQPRTLKFQAPERAALRIESGQVLRARYVNANISTALDYFVISSAQ